MTLTLKPKGRGNWAAITMSVAGARVSPLFVRVGQTLFFGGVTWRIVSRAAMSKTSAILVCPMVALRSIPPAEVDVIRRFLFEHMRGMDSRSDKRWRRLWGRLWKAEPGEGFQLYSAEQRSGPFHRRHRVILERLFQSQERFRNIDALHDWLKIGAYWVTWGEGRRGQPIPVPRSTSFPDCSEDEMREAHAAMVDYLHTERAQRFLWRHLKPAKRAEMLEIALRNPDEEGDRP